MSNNQLTNIKLLREKTQAPILEIKKALEKSNNDILKAEVALKEWSDKKAASKAGEATSMGVVEAYIHSGKVGAMVILTCQTDFVARTNEFKKLAKEIAMQVASMDPKDVNDLLKQSYIRDAKITINDIIKEKVAKLGENIKIKKIIRFSI
ncbi:elongation factor Ts [Candidatus Gottesmanbacteria bacterium]|nr:elongation factor Ts [Candidatus Gottesmanbacteria bacterium]